MLKHFHPLLLLLAAALCAPMVKAASPNAAAASIGADLWARFASRHHCFLVMEDAYSAKTGTYTVNLPAAPPPGCKTIRAAVRFLRSKLPTCTVWRDRLDGHIIHVVYTKALKWKANPLNQRLTFHATMSLKQVATQIIRKRFPRANILCFGDQKNFALPGPGISQANERAYNTPRRFDVKGMTLRQFLSTGVAYKLARPRTPVILWEASYFLRRSKFTGRVDITIFGVPQGAPPAPATHGHAAK